MARCIKEFLKQQNIAFKDFQLYEEAFTHSSYVNEMRGKAKLVSNERLEYLGDAALQLCCSTYLFAEKSFEEGDLTRLRANLVREEALAKYAEVLNLSDYLRLGKGEIKTGGKDRPSLKADLFEAFIGALYLDLGFEATMRFLEPVIKKGYDMIKAADNRDFKSKLQEFVQADSKRAITYELLNATGPAHERIFEMAVKLDEMTLGVGKAASKKEAEQLAAKVALSKLAVD